MQECFALLPLSNCPSDIECFHAEKQNLKLVWGQILILHQCDLCCCLNCVVSLLRLSPHSTKPGMLSYHRHTFSASCCTRSHWNRFFSSRHNIVTTVFFQTPMSSIENMKCFSKIHIRNIIVLCEVDKCSTLYSEINISYFRPSSVIFGHNWKTF